MIDLSRVKGVLSEVDTLIEDLDGFDLDDSNAIGQTKGARREERARASQDLQLLATRLELAANLVRVEYWYARGEIDPLDPDRTEAR